MTPAEFRACRKSLGLTQAQLAALFGLTDRQVRRFEANSSVASHEAPTAALAIALRLLADPSEATRDAILGGG